MSTIEIKRMSKIERLHLMERLWDSFIKDEEGENESPEWHEETLKNRKEKIESGKAEFISLEKLKASRKL